MKIKSLIAPVLGLALALVVGSQASAQMLDLRGMLELGNRIRHTRIEETAEIIVHDGRALLLGLIRSTGDGDTSVFIRDTDTANGHVADNRLVIPALRFFIGTSVTDNPIPYPMLMENGISIDLDGAGNEEELTVIYLPVL